MNIRHFAALLLLAAAPTIGATANPTFEHCRGVSCCTPAGGSASCVAQQWRFSVSLDGKAIGYHHFALNERGTTRELHSQARFKVKFLFVNAYSYAHDAKERWHGECLSQLEARTDDNGEKIQVRGTRGESAFVIATAALTATVTPCVQTFAYWNPQILTATHLLNPQTGEYVPVRVTQAGTETIEVRGRQVTAERYRIVGEDTDSAPLQIDLWYSTDRNRDDKQWLALESLAEGGRRLRYTMQ